MKNLLVMFLFIAGCYDTFAQLTTFEFKRKINHGDPGWYTISLPDDIFSRINREFSDIRVLNIINGDSTELPYLLKIRINERSSKSLNLPVLNKSEQNGMLFFTFKIPNNQKANQLQLSFAEENFNAFASVEGSHDQRTWFTLVSDQRILSIQNGQIDFIHTTVNFPSSDYIFLRVSVKSDIKKLTLTEASLDAVEALSGIYQPVPSTWEVEQKQNTRQTIVTAELKQLLPVAGIRIDASHDLDFYRFFVIEAVSDSIKTEKGYTRFYDQLFSGYITSILSNEFNFKPFSTDELKVFISNQDNSPLEIRSIEILIPRIEIITPLKSGDNFLVYGSKTATKPSYDLVYFSDKVPQNPSVATLLEEEATPVTAPSKQNPLFASAYWLWIILIVTILVLGFFTIRMLQSKKTVS